jgi:hypothetical protein
MCVLGLSFPEVILAAWHFREDDDDDGDDDEEHDLELGDFNLLGAYA